MTKHDSKQAVQSTSETSGEGSGLLGWIDRRFPLTALWKNHLSEYYAPKNFNFWYFFGSLALLVLVIQIVTGIFLTMNYKPAAELAFTSVEYIMREVPWGWLIRYMHSTGASMFFVVLYLHMFRGLLYGSYRKPRELVWILGCLIFLCLMAEAFFGYLLPWGQMSYWGAQVIVNLFSAIPWIGPDLALWIRGDYVVSDATLNRFFAFHVIAIPLVLLLLVALHLVALHQVGSNNPDGIEIKDKKDEHGVPLDGVPFHPYYTVHDLMGVSIFLMIFSAIVFFAPEMGGYFLEANNFIPADSLKTPTEIAPVWYFTAFYSMLRATTDDFKLILMIVLGLIGVCGVLRARTLKYRAISAVASALVIAAMRITEAKFWGVVIMGGAVITLFFLPWLDRSPARSIRYRPFFHKILYTLFVFVFLILAVLGTKPPSPVANVTSQICTLLYFAFFFSMPYWSQRGVFKPVPERVTFSRKA
ncbi:cytochrome B subunit protein [Mycoavidus cysteinexigens]|uniref:Cytochrome b n=1 Tax=Mycoavidus cysteinexigens TaxID=1553431 RepID=A0A2Z6ESS3_9BURK|nr:cytochrome bc complex cytochrome b subunit [Mycoavidus cysteinexigens]BBE08467.1 cytochrome B subunit protein [Mycoavidus cysteinexigens]GAM52818.1 ubiquinol-cytochrome C reductase, cytochrome B subunit [bacterium endosymbiont of Mortierella elongata FMR23-6]GLR00973.1 cytochrome b [Mycoavidus cysteinexigens]